MTKQPFSVVVHVSSAPYQQPANKGSNAPSGYFSEEKFGEVTTLDPHRAHLDWPALWASYLRCAFAGPMMSERIAMAFQVSERTARNWLKEEGGCNGRHTRIAMQRDPILAMNTLYGMAAE